MKPHRGTLILVLGILSFVFCGIFTAIPAWIMGNSDLKEMDAGTMDPAGRGLTNAGRILGMILTILTILAFLAFIALFFLGFMQQSGTKP
jgi:disulfide bond formation protein DsbB